MNIVLEFFLLFFITVLLLNKRKTKHGDFGNKNIDNLLLPVKCRKRKELRMRLLKKETMRGHHFDTEKVFSSNGINPTVAWIRSHINQYIIKRVGVAQYN